MREEVGYGERKRGWINTFRIAVSSSKSIGVNANLELADKPSCLGFGIYGLGFRVQGVGCRVRNWPTSCSVWQRV